MARRRRNKGRNISGIFLLDKPVGMTSNAALQRVKRLFNANKAGHTGNLDPMASGLLPICLGEATKVSGFLLDSDKHYTGTCKLGERTDSGDADGVVVQTRLVEDYSETRILEIFSHFKGEISQIPPMHSAIKVNGQPLYKLAHQGIEIERKPRQVEIFSLELLRQAGDELDIDVHCSKGTYIRTLVQDIGEELGCGAHLTALRRIAAGPFSIENGCTTLTELEKLAEDGFAAMDARLLLMESALADWPQVKLTRDSTYYLRQGQAVQVAKAPTRGWVCLFADDNRFLGVGQILGDGRVAPRRLINST
ncbi:MAG TPA: tRNA pseudouridine(55) synthase TruB [Gammaproteobacteria bacterium]|nr:tRNA pseudouridine(55) synthase TruB [Gammaproteobacteria bacterium]